MEHFAYTKIGFLIFKWIHFLAGITWIGVLYYFNFIQGEWFKEIENQTKGTAVRTLVPRALWWFRWGAMFTFLSGVIMLGLHGHSSLVFGANSYTLNIYVGSLLGILMFLNVWLVIWPAQKVVIASSESVANGGEAHPEAAYCLSSAGLASRTNTLFSIPMLFFMAAARGLNLPISTDPATASISTAMIVASVTILLLQANALYGKTGPMTSVKGVIHCGVVLTLVLYLCVIYLVV